MKLHIIRLDKSTWNISSRAGEFFCSRVIWNIMDGDIFQIGTLIVRRKVIPYSIEAPLFENGQIAGWGLNGYVYWMGEWDERYMSMRMETHGNMISM